MKIYVIEDNTVYNEYVCNLLKKGGFKTEQAYHLNTAKKMLTKIGDDDIVLADLRLPDGDGIALLEELRRQGMNNPSIVMTAYAEVPTAVRSMKSGAEEYIPKPQIEANLFPLLKTLQKRTERPRHTDLRAWRKRSIPTHLERHNPPTIIAKMGLKRA